MQAMHGDQLHAQDLCIAQFSADRWRRLLQISSMGLNPHPRTTPDSILVRYTARIAAGEIEGDFAQQEIVAGLAALEADLATWRLARKSSSLGWLFGSRARAAIKGYYIYGDV